MPWSVPPRRVRLVGVRPFYLHRPFCHLFAGDNDFVRAHSGRRTLACTVDAGAERNIDFKSKQSGMDNMPTELRPLQKATRRTS